MMKKGLIIIIFLFFAIFFSPVSRTRVFATQTTQEIEEEKILEEIESQIDEMDFSDIEQFYEENINFESFEDRSFVEVIKSMISGEVVLGFDEIIESVLSAIKIDIIAVLKLVALLVVIVGFGAFSDMLRSSKKESGGMGGVVNYLILTIILSLVASIVADFVLETTSLLSRIKGLMEVLFPILLSLVVTVGGSGLGATLQPAVVVLTNGVIGLVTTVTTIVVSLYLVLSVVGELTDFIKLDKLKGFVVSTYKWVIGLIFTIFMGYLSVNGILASGRDGISVKTAKYALRSYLPIVGGYVSDSYEIFRAGSVLIKNSVGVFGVVLLFGLVVGKVLTMSVYNLGFKLASGLSEPFGMNKITRFLSSLSTLFSFLIAGVVACFLLSIITLLVFVSSANI